MGSATTWRRIEAACRYAAEDCTPLVAVDAHAALGCLARWWLTDDVLSRALTTQGVQNSAQWLPPRIPPHLEAIWLLLCLKDTSEFPLLRPSVPLPVAWIQGVPDAPQLPGGLIAEAKRVRSTLRQDSSCGKPNLDDWGLVWPHSSFADIDLSEMELTSGSAFAPLAAGLLVKLLGGRLNPMVWSTGAWRDDDDHTGAPQGISIVDSIGEKAKLAAIFGATHLFVPKANRVEAQLVLAEMPTRPKLHIIPHTKPQPREALRELLVLLQVPPDRRDSTDQRADYYFLQATTNGQQEDARKYYRHQLVADIASRCRSQLPLELQEKEIDWLVAIVSNSPEIVYLNAELFRPRNCLLFYTDDSSPDGTRMQRLANQLMYQLDADAIRTTLVPIESTLSLSGLVKLFRAKISRNAVGSKVVDLTPGATLMKLALLQAVGHDAWKVVIDSQFDEIARRARPFTETLHVWRELDVGTVDTTIDAGIQQQQSNAH